MSGPWGAELRVLAVAAAAALLVGLGLWWRRARRRRRGGRPPPAPRPLPVVLVHGLFGFDEIAVGGARHAYFRGIGPRLEQEGRHVVHARVPAVGPVRERAAALAACVAGVEARRVLVLAHSMGGLDARYALARLGMARRVAALVTVGTPHRGTPVADLTAEVAARIGLTRALALAGVGLEALHDLTSERMERFNEEVRDRRGVTYGCVLGQIRRKRRSNPLLVPTHLWLADRAGANDGVVPISSQRWGEVLAEVEADHWAQIGWSKGFDAPAFYAALLRDLDRRCR